MKKTFMQKKSKRSDCLIASEYFQSWSRKTYANRDDSNIVILARYRRTPPNVGHTACSYRRKTSLYLDCRKYQILLRTLSKEWSNVSFVPKLTNANGENLQREMDKTNVSSGQLFKHDGFKNPKVFGCTPWTSKRQKLKKKN